MESFLVHVANGQIGIAVHDDTVLVDLMNLGQIDNVGTVNTHEIVGQSLFHFFHRKQGDNRFRLAFNPHLKIFAHSLYISDVRDIDFDDTIVSSPVVVELLPEPGVVVDPLSSQL